ncbi:big defensin-like [Octopus sinensis]|uniref:Big defensin-like n=1 Tax=Octopus sinensis TaxID=2607531 RepID=A0A7E6EN05_9MOLL|nr:big defensin-like [Octopus sinensis]
MFIRHHCQTRLQVILILSIVFSFWLQPSESPPPPPYNKGDRGGSFLYTIPARYINATLGPGTYRWIVRLYGEAAAYKNNIRRAPSDSHVCGPDGWCRHICRPTERKDWFLKDICGAFACCRPT